MMSICPILGVFFVILLISNSVLAACDDDDDGCMKNIRDNNFVNDDDFDNVWDEFTDNFSLIERGQLLAGVIFGSFIGFVVLMTVCCYCCPACPAYKRRTRGRGIQQNVTMSQIPTQSDYNQQQPPGSQTQFPDPPPGQAYPKQPAPYNPNVPAHPSYYPQQMGYVPTGASAPYEEPPPPYPGLPEHYGAQNHPTSYPGT